MDRPTTYIGLTVDKSIYASVGACEGISTLPCFIHHPGIYRIANQTGPGITQNHLVGILGRMCGNLALIKGHIGAQFGFGLGYGRVNTCPIIVVHTGIFGIVIPVDIESSPDANRLGVFTIVRIRLKYSPPILTGRSGLIIVVYHIVTATLSGITVVGAPIEQHIVAKVHQLFIGQVGIAAATKTWYTTVVMHQKIVVKTRLFTAPNAHVTMPTLVVHRITKTLGKQTPLHGKIVVVVERRSLIGGPAHGTMIQDNILPAPPPDGIVLRRLFVAHSKAQKTNNKIAGIYLHRVVL